MPGPESDPRRHTPGEVRDDTRQDAGAAGTSRRQFLLLGGGTIGALGLSAAGVSSAAADAAKGTPAAAARGVTPLGLRAAAMTDPLGIDVERPTLSWRLGLPAGAAPTAAAVRQKAYQVQVATSAAALGRGRPDLWDSGRVSGARTFSVPYGGKPVPARTQAFWRVRVWDEQGGATAWSAPAVWETGLLDAGDWAARWIGNAEWEQPYGVTAQLAAPRTARYVRVTVTDLGRPASALDDTAHWKPQLQISEIAVRDSARPGVDLAHGAPVTASDTLTVPGQWAPEYLTDGKLTSTQAPYGYQSSVRSDTDISDDPVVLTLDLGSAVTFDSVVVYQRWDAPSQWGMTPDYPRTFSVSAADDPAGPFTGVADVKKDDKPYPPSSMHDAPAALPLFAKDFTVSGEVARARLYISAAGIHAATVNGRAAGTAVLEPPNTNVLTEVPYATYDVTKLLASGRNTVGVEIGNGMWDVFNTLDNPSRYIKATAGFGPPRLIAQLEIRYTDGRSHTVATDGSWLTALGPTTFSNWYGGEDFDARRVQPRWDHPEGDRRAWQQAAVTAPPAPGTALVGRLAPPIEIVDVHPAVAITSPSEGVYVIDFATNSAGWQQLRMSGPAGTTVTMLPGEKLTAAGTVDQSTTGKPIYDTYVTAGSGEEIWQPRFVYHGFRYLEVRGLPRAPSLGDAKTLVLRTANPEAGSFTCSDDLLNSIHTIIDRSVQSNMYSVFTDCPHREKLGWLDQTGLALGAATRNYDIEAYGRKLVRDMIEAQAPDGMVPTTAPEIALFAGAYRYDANWGGSIVLVPWQLYRAYGDTSTLRSTYPAMKRYLEYLGGLASGDLLDGGLGDWESVETTTPTKVVQTYAYKRLATTLAHIAGVLGERSDAKRYDALAARITAAFNAAYLDASGATYASGSQACNALALDAGFVPAARSAAVLATLIAAIRAAGNHLEVGEVGLPAALRVLAGAGRHDVIWDIATQTTYPSYGHMVATGSTSLAESWGGMGTSASQNHWMLGALEEWFTAGLGGITQTADSVAFSELALAPAVVGDLTTVDATYDTPHGRVASSWRRSGTSLSLAVSVPPNTSATVAVPLAPAGGAKAVVTPSRGAVLVRRDADTAVYRVGTGAWSFRAARP
ncbi:family 78 glycoside hydrolase catalytic domain [Actinacidiphila sp. bgisy145]|uniref:family 78 glycoside hydrolase catalytic domain n=1 Tax=Actinacidiphila sp. bgisy145 TaxID=3413792 RepID=UPI003EBE4BFD